jgi:hypothetical protein
MQVRTTCEQCKSREETNIEALLNTPLAGPPHDVEHVERKINADVAYYPGVWVIGDKADLVLCAEQVHTQRSIAGVKLARRRERIARS